jgi:hypothetical protein
MKYINRVLWLVVLLLAFPLALVAQSGTRTVDLGDGYEITVPDGWELDTSQDDMVVFYGETLALGVNTPVMLEAMGWDPADFVDAVDALVNLGSTADGSALTRNDTAKAQFDGRSAATYNGPLDEASDNLQVALELSDGSYGFLVFVGTTSDLDAAQDEIEAIAASFDVAESAPAAAAGSGATCTVRASNADAGQLRVGPGENRSAIAFLPANTSVTVTGRIELDDGSVWYQLDKAEAAPQGTAASELWVNAENVSATGDCDTVGETNAPPVIPISVAPPAATAAPGEPQQPPAQAGALPAAGVWTIVLNPVTNASCLGYDNIQVNTADLFTPTTYVESIVVLDGGTFRIGGDVFRRAGTSNSFTGVLTFSPTSEVPIAQMRFDLQSATAMNGDLVANYNFDDLLCSHTATFTATR